MARKTKDIEALLQTKFGFAPAKTRSSDHRWYELYLKGLPAIVTKVSHGEKDIGDGLQGKIARQLRVRKKFFDGMMDCTNNRDAYYKKVREDAYPPFTISF